MILGWPEHSFCPWLYLLHCTAPSPVWLIGHCFLLAVALSFRHWILYPPVALQQWALSAFLATPHASDCLWLFANAFTVNPQLAQVELYLLPVSFPLCLHCGIQKFVLVFFSPPFVFVTSLRDSATTVSCVNVWGGESNQHWRVTAGELAKWLLKRDVGQCRWPLVPMCFQPLLGNIGGNVHSP